MGMLELRRNPTPRDLRVFAFGCVAILLLAAFSLRQFQVMVVVLLLTSTIFVAVGLFRPSALGGIYRTWIAITYPINWIVSHLIMAVVFFGIFLPTGRLLRLLGMDPLTRNFDEKLSTYWVDREDERQGPDYLKPY
ncbi:MAG: hypothetical protein JNL58_31145 [Planctomyces sp.]|nr:hypothetical protein [Planctomyces sp.]